MIKRFFIFICLYSIILQNSYADSYKKISYIKEISEAVKNANQNTLVVFDVDYVIFTPPDLIGRPKGLKIRNEIYKDYYKEERNNIHSLYYLKTSEEFVEKEIKEIILDLYEHRIPTVALTAVGAGRFGNIDDSVNLRVSRLKEKGINFSFENSNKRILWNDDSAFEAGVIFSGKQPKGEALQYFLENIIQWKPKHIIFVDDKLEHLKSVHEMCNKLEIKFTGFHYKAAVFDLDQELNPEIAKFQLKTLYEQKILIPDSEAKKIIKKDKEYYITN